jgi:primosomal protein N' (replication factor Y)
VTLLEGVTGSGKTEVYFEAVAEALRLDRQALILMPEIALTAQFLDRFAARFGVRPAAWHSGVSGRRRERLYAAIASGEARVVVGARSALFLLYDRLGLMVVDEEHEAAYKQEDGVHYNARDMAVVRGRIEGCPVVLASATPSIETRVNVERGRYSRVALPERFAGRKLPDIRAVDLKREQMPKGRWISPTLGFAIDDTLERGEQALLFLNRRGYAPLTLCGACAHRYECRNCSAWLVEHRFRRALVCHHCGHAERRPEACTQCGTFDSLVSCGPGVERIAEEVAERFPGRRTIVLSSDFPGGAERLRAELAAIAAGEVELVVGTQLVAKGHNFPLLTLVGVLDADIGLTSGDPRAAERTFQLLQQVTGRAGRGEKPGRALLQTWQPEHPVIARWCRATRSASTPRRPGCASSPGSRPSGASRRWSCRPSSATPRRPTPGPWPPWPTPPPASPCWARGGPHRPHPGPPPLPASREDRAGGGPPGLPPGLARALAQGPWQRAGHGGRGPAELPLRSSPRQRRFAMTGRTFASLLPGLHMRDQIS